MVNAFVGCCVVKCITLRAPALLYPLLWSSGKRSLASPNGEHRVAGELDKSV